MLQRGEFMLNRPDIEKIQKTEKILDDYLRRISFRSEVFYRGQVCEDWALDISGKGHINFHVVCHGDCWLRMPELKEPLPLQEGDVIVLPHDSSHLILSAPGLPAKYGQIIAPHQIIFDRNSSGTALVCGYLIVDKSVFKLVFSILPNYLIIRSRQNAGAGQFRMLIDLLFAEAQANRVGASAVLDRLADALMFYVIRHSMEQNTQTTGLLAALADKRIRSALVAICDDPAREWSVDTLAEQASMSRSGFSECFHGLVGQAPIDFLNEWRMQLARGWLERDRLSVAEVSERCGYRSEAAFSKAFKRIVGIGPGEFRRVHASRKDTHDMPQED